MEGPVSLDPPGLLRTADGSLTAHSSRYGQAYSSVHGAASQARTVFVQGTGTDTTEEARVLEVGFGLGHNFRETLRARRPDAALHYLAFEFDPAPREVLEALGPADGGLWSGALERWGQTFTLSDGPRTLDVRVQDVTRAELPDGWATAVYLDGFSPTVNPEVWTPELLARLAAALAPGGRLATYSAAGAVRRGLEAAGLHVEKRRGLAGKREFLVAVKP